MAIRAAGPRQYKTLRWFEVGIFSSSRYLAIVRRASSSPSRCRMLTIFESLSGLRGSSFSMIFRMRCLMVTEGTQVLDAVIEEVALEVDDAVGDLVNGLLALLHRLDQPERRAELVLYVRAR